MRTPTTPLQVTLRPPFSLLQRPLPEALTGRTNPNFTQGIRLLAVRATISASRRQNNLFVIFYIFFFTTSLSRAERGVDFSSQVPRRPNARLGEAERRPLQLKTKVLLHPSKNEGAPAS